MLLISKCVRLHISTVIFFTIMLMTASSWGASLASISGNVLDEATGQPVTGARVFIEQGLTYPIEAVRSNTEGHYEFQAVIPGRINVFAYREGFAFGGFSILAGAGDNYDNQPILLKKPSSVSGQITGQRKKAVRDAQVTRVVVSDGELNDPASRKFSIPFSKIRRFGFQIPTSNAKGSFLINRLPTGESIAIKVNHAKFAQQATAGINVGLSNVRVSLTPGILISGSVLSRDSNNPISNAPIVFRNSFPPHETIITRTGGDGVYALRLRPGAYTYESVGSTYKSVAKPRVIVSGENATQQIDLIVSGKGTLTGKVLDAVTESPVAGAQIALEIGGTPYEITQTGKNGEYTFAAPKGKCTVRFWRAPGYLPPPTPGFSIHLNPEQTKIVNTFWLKAIPAYSLEVLDENKTPVSGAIVQLLYPRQIGWRSTDENGLVSISMATLPENGIIIGYVDHPTDHTGALFAIDASRADDAIIQLRPLRSIQGRIVDERKKGLAGQLVSCETGHTDLSNPVNVWKIMSDSKGNFRHPGVIEGRSLIYTAVSPDTPDTDATSSVLFTVTGSEESILPSMSISNGSSGESLIGKTFPWGRLSRVKDSGTQATSDLPTANVVVFTKAESAVMLLDSLETAQQFLKPLGKQFVLVVSEPTTLNSKTIPLYHGTPPASADTYIVSSKGNVIFETIDLPTYSVIRDSTLNP